MNPRDLKTQADYEALWLEEVGQRIKRLECSESQLIPLEAALNLASAVRSKPIEADE